MIISIVILPDLAEANKVEALGRWSADREAAGHPLGGQVEVVFAAISDIPVLSVV